MTGTSLDEPTPQDRLGDLLIRQKALAPHQLGVALDVQQRTRLPIGRILLEAEIVSWPRLTLALLEQKLRRTLPGRKSRRAALYGLELVSWARARLERHLATTPKQEDEAALRDSAQTRLRTELACPGQHTSSRIIEKDDVLKKRLLTGNF